MVYSMYSVAPPIAKTDVYGTVSVVWKYSQKDFKKYCNRCLITCVKKMSPIHERPKYIVLP